MLYFKTDMQMQLVFWGCDVLTQTQTTTIRCAAYAYPGCQRFVLSSFRSISVNISIVTCAIKPQVQVI